MDSRARFDKLKAHAKYEDVLDSLAVYVAEVIPWADTTEGRLWTVTALPSTSKRKGHRRLVTLSIQNVEVLFMGEEIGSAGSTLGYTAMHVAVMEDVPQEISHVLYEIDGYASAGPVHRVDADGLDVIPSLLTLPQVRRAARALALGQLRKGKGAFTRHHNDSLGDAIFARIDDLYPEGCLTTPAD